MRRRGEISLGDVLRAVRELAPQDVETRRLLLRALDPQGLMSSLWAGHSGEAERLPPRRPPPPAASKPAASAALPSPASEPLQEPPRAGEVIPSRLSRSGVSESALQLPGGPVEVLERATSLPDLPPPAPLFMPDWHTGILTAALGVPHPEGPLDVARLVPRLARRLPVKTFPRRQVRSLRLGAQVLVDVSESMAPFVEDRKQLLARVRAVVGTDRLEVRQFEGAPSRGVRTRPGAALLPFVPSSPEIPVLVLTDLGIGASVFSHERSEPEEWLRFEEVARRAGSRVVTLVPYSPARWPRALRRRMHLLHWDRQTTARAVLQELQR